MLEDRARSSQTLPTHGHHRPLARTKRRPRPRPQPLLFPTLHPSPSHCRTECRQRPARNNPAFANMHPSSRFVPFSRMRYGEIRARRIERVARFTGALLAGPRVISIHRDTGRITGSRASERFHIANQNGAPVSTMPFLDAANAGISALIGFAGDRYPELSLPL